MFSPKKAPVVAAAAEEEAVAAAPVEEEAVAKASAVEEPAVVEAAAVEAPKVEEAAKAVHPVRPIQFPRSKYRNSSFVSQVVEAPVAAEASKEAEVVAEPTPAAVVA